VFFIQSGNICKASVSDNLCMCPIKCDTLLFFSKWSLPRKILAKILYELLVHLMCVTWFIYLVYSVTITMRLEVQMVELISIFSSVFSFKVAIFVRLLCQITFAHALLSVTIFCFFHWKI